MNVLIWGTGNTAKSVLKEGINGNIVGFVRSTAGGMFQGKPVYTPKTIAAAYDVIYVASLFSDEICGAIHEADIPLEKVCFMNLPKATQIDVAANYHLAQQFLSGNSLEMVDERAGEKHFILQDLKAYNALNTRPSFQYDESRKYFIGTDKYVENGGLSYYFFQDLWGAQKVRQAAPKTHYDIGSRVDGLIAHLLSFRENVVLIDIRPMDLQLPGLKYIQADATNLDGIADNSIESLSALCSLEHFGLGRYGDPVDPEACFKAFAAIQRKMTPGGNVYIAVPVGEEHVEFNAHRVFYARTIVEAFSEMELVEFSAIEGGNMQINYHVPLDRYDSYHQGGDIDGLFHFRKPLRA